MTRLTIGRLPYWAMAVLLGALTFGIIYLGFRIGLGLYSFVLLLLPIGLAVWYMAEYSVTEAVAPPAAIDPTVSAPPAEAFDDPVVEADLFDSLLETEPRAEAGTQDPPP
nr:membrane protein [uncultured euryarchaeote]